jgi:hypothetical protein
MNWVYIHILINHVPVILGGLAALAALFALVSGRRAAWLYTAITLTLAGLSAYPTSLTGERASRIFRQREPSARAAIHAHSQAADVTLWILLGSGLLGAIAWYRIGSDDPKAPVPGWAKVALTLPALASLGAVAITSERGGKISHQPWETSLSAPPLISTDSTIKIPATPRPATQDSTTQPKR